MSPTLDSNHVPRLLRPFSLFTQGGASRLRRFALPWAGMLRPLRAFGAKMRVPTLLEPNQVANRQGVGAPTKSRRANWRVAPISQT